MLNKVILMGRCGSDPEKRSTGNGTPVTTVNIAVDRDFADKQTGDKETDWITVVAWRETANFLANNFKKGKMVVVVGRLQIRKWTDKDGNKRSSAEVVADNVYFGDSKSSTQDGNQANGYTAPANSFAPASDFAMINDPDAELPF